MLNNVENFYLSCFVVANVICNINRFDLQELGKIVEECLTCEELVGATLRFSVSVKN